MKDYTKVCPECGSDNITITQYPVISSPMSLGAHCQDCGHQGGFIEMTKNHLKKFKKFKKKEKKIDVNLPKDSKIINPIHVIIGIIFIIIIIFLFIK